LQQVVELGDDPGVVGAQGPAAVDQHPQHGELLVVDHRPQPGHPVLTSATEWASLASVLRPCPVQNTRARADSFGGTSTTSWWSSSSRSAMWRPIPLQPSIAQTRSGHRPRYSSIDR
jgi:hypothetical protein